MHDGILMKLQFKTHPTYIRALKIIFTGHWEHKLKVRKGEGVGFSWQGLPK